jgi:hypothetical protein
MDAKRLRKIISAFPDNATPMVWRWNGKVSFHSYLEFASKQNIKEKILFRLGCNVDRKETDKWWEKCPDQFNNMRTPDYKEIVEKILQLKDMLPALLGLDEDLDLQIHQALGHLQSGSQTT